MLWEDNYLAHYGIKGQQWGVRRFQNEDGSYTDMGRTRYSRGKALSEELSRMRKDEFNRLKKSSKEYQSAEKEANRLLEKYKLDADDGGGGDRNRYSDKVLERAGQRYWEKVEDMSALDDIFNEKARDLSTKKFVNKYGESALSDIKHYSNVKTGIFLGSLGLIAATKILLKMKHK